MSQLIVGKTKWIFGPPYLRIQTQDINAGGLALSRLVWNFPLFQLLVAWDVISRRSIFFWPMLDLPTAYGICPLLPG